MTDIKCVINDVKAGKSYQKQISDANLIGRKIGEKIQGSLFGLSGYELEVTGGSDSAGFPMVPFIEGPGRKKALLSRGIGARIKERGIRVRKTVRGNAISNFTAQVNMKIVNYGAKSVEELLGVKPKEEIKKEEIKKEEKKEKDKTEKVNLSK